MAFFSKVRKAKRAADAHKASQTGTEKEPAATAYRHVPTHAAQDALSSAPASWTVQEAKLKIAAYKGKTALVRSNSDVSLTIRPYISRTDSDLSIESVMKHQNRPSSSQSSYRSSIPATCNGAYFTHSSSSRGTYNASSGLKSSPLSNSSLSSESMMEEDEPAESSQNSTTSGSRSYSQILEMSRSLHVCHEPSQPVTPAIL